MKRITFFKCFKIDDAIRSGLRSFNKEAGYPIDESNKLQQEPDNKLNLHTGKKSLFNMVKLLAILKNIFL